MPKPVQIHFRKFGLEVTRRKFLQVQILGLQRAIEASIGTRASIKIGILIGPCSKGQEPAKLEVPLISKDQTKINKNQKINAKYKALYRFKCKLSRKRKEREKATTEKRKGRKEDRLGDCKTPNTAGDDRRRRWLVGRQAFGRRKREAQIK